MTGAETTSHLTLVAGEGPAARRREVLARLDAIVDPCSKSLGRPAGLVAMGIVERLDVAGGAVAVLLLPTFPTCLFRGYFEEEIKASVAALPWCSTVTTEFCAADRLWDESRMAPEARRGLRDGQ
jgi:metal-sulfur cluster biosynthetic enzyme